MAAAASPSTAPAAAPAPKPREPLSVTLRKAGWRALGGGLSGGAAMVVQVLTLMPMRTTMNFQYRYGMSTVAAFKKLKADGGFVRFYRGLAPALIQAPLSRFGDTAANAGALALFDSFDSTASLPVAVKTVGASIAAASLRVLLVPVDTVKTIMQVEGKGGMAALSAKVAKHGPSTLFHGALASAAATFAGHYPWFATFNTLNEMVPRQTETVYKLLRSAGIGFCATLVSDTVSNSLRAIKTTRQASVEVISYPAAVRGIIASRGVTGLLFGGLGTRLMANGLQGIMFAVLWKLLEEQWNKPAAGAAAAGASPLK